MHVVRVTDTSDARLGDYAALTDAALRKRYEHRHGVLIAEGPSPVGELLRSRYPVRSVLVTERRLDDLRDRARRGAPDDDLAVLLERLDASVPVYTVADELLHALVRFRLHQGVLACGARLPLGTVAEVVAGARRVVALEGVGDHENLGTLFRTVRALGGDAVVLGPRCADPLYRRSVRVSMGHVLQVPFATVATTEELLATLHAAGLVTVALTPAPDAVEVRELAVAPGDRLALLLGAEGPGLSDVALAGCRARVRIAMHDGVDSLNVAAAGAIALHALAGLARGGTSLPPSGAAEPDGMP